MNEAITDKTVTYKVFIPTVKRNRSCINSSGFFIGYI